MKKQEILSLLKENNVSTSNLTTFMRRKAANRKAVESVRGGEKKVRQWLRKAEEKAEAEAQRKALKAEADKFNLSVKEYLELKEKAEYILSDFDTGHSMGCYRRVWIGGYCFAKNDSTQEYAKSCTYTPTYGKVQLDITKKDLRNIQNINGVWTVMHGESKCKWLEESGQKQYHSVKWATGYCYKGTHAETLKEARRLHRIKQAQKNYEASTFVGMKDRTKFGACEQGVLAFCRRHGLNPEYGYSIAYLKTLDDKVAEKYLN